MPTYIYRYVTKPKAKKQSLLLIITICNAKATLRPSARNKNAKSRYSPKHWFEDNYL